MYYAYHYPVNSYQGRGEGDRQRDRGRREGQKRRPHAQPRRLPHGRGSAEQCAAEGQTAQMYICVYPTVINHTLDTLISVSINTCIQCISMHVYIHDIHTCIQCMSMHVYIHVYNACQYMYTMHD